MSISVAKVTLWLKFEAKLSSKNLLNYLISLFVCLSILFGLFLTHTYLRSSYMYFTCCIAGRGYTIGFLRFCKQVMHLLHSNLISFKSFYLISSNFCKGNSTILHNQTIDGRAYNHFACFQKVSRWRFQVIFFLLVFYMLDLFLNEI